MSKNKKTNPKPIFKNLTFIFALWIIGYGLYIGSVLTKTIQDETQKTDAIIVLTGGENRIDEGLRLFADGMAPELFITGVFPGVQESELIKNWDGKPLPSCCITLGYEATTTFQNAQETKEWLKDHKDVKTIRLVTANYHMNRALLEFKHALHGYEIISHPIIQNEVNPSKLWFWIINLKEYNKTLVRWISFMLTAKANHGDH